MKHNDTNKAIEKIRKMGLKAEIFGSHEYDRIKVWIDVAYVIESPRGFLKNCKGNDLIDWVEKAQDERKKILDIIGISYD